MGEDRQSKLLTVLLALILVIAVATAGGVLQSILISSDSRAATTATKETVDVAACRSVIRLPIDRIANERSELIISGLAALRAGDDEALDAAIARGSQLEAESNEAFDAYFAALARSTQDPTAFVAECPLPSGD